jgi:hypothetical protein
MEFRGFQGFQYKRAYLAVKLKAKYLHGQKVYAEFYVSAHEFLGYHLFTQQPGDVVFKDSIYDQGNEPFLPILKLMLTQLLMIP